MLLHGGCHCGRVEVSFETALVPAMMEIRACQCSFCRRHGAKTVTDPNGNLTIAAPASGLSRYRFGLRTADYILCANCGVYIAAVINDGPEKRATLNAAGLMIEGLCDRPAKPVDLDHEDAAGRRERRHRNWTPTHFMTSAARRSG
jgi:hypothetical protein